MRGVILAAGDGGRMGEYTDDVPKAFLEVAGRTLYERQRELLDPHVDDVTIVLGYRHEHVLDRVGDADVVVFEDWREFDNAESLRRAVAGVDDDVLVLNGDVLVARRVTERLVRCLASLPAEESVVACTTERRSEHTAVDWDDEGYVTDYGLIDGHRHAGLGVVAASQLDRADAILRDNAEGWYPVLYPALPTRRVLLPTSHHVEINRPADLRRARERLAGPARTNAVLEV